VEYATLGGTGLLVSRLAFGAMTFTAGNRDIGAVFKAGRELADQLVGRALERGVTFFDTANGYAGGESEQLLGAALSVDGYVVSSLTTPDACVRTFVAALSPTTGCRDVGRHQHDRLRRQQHAQAGELHPAEGPPRTAPPEG
jgi:hypothetical protein